MYCTRLFGSEQRGLDIDLFNLSLVSFSRVIGNLQLISPVLAVILNPRDLNDCVAGFQIYSKVVLY